MINVIKKDGSVEPWNFNKIVAAISKSANRISTTLTTDDVASIGMMIPLPAAPADIPVERVHGMVENALRKVRPDVAESYANYRNYRKDIVEIWEDIYQKTKDVLYLGDRENANFNSALISTKGSLVRGYLTKDLFKKFYLSKTELDIIEDGYLYFHDLRDLIFGSFNCCLVDMATVLRGGFEMSGVKYKEPKTLLSALQVIGDVTLVATAQQYGGFTIPEIDKILLPYALKSEARHQAEAIKYGIADPVQYVIDKMNEEIMQGFQSLEMKLNTVPSSRGDTAFVTISFGDVQETDEKAAAMQRAICAGILQTRMNGQGNGSPVVFPKLVYLHSEKQHEDPEQARLFEMAIECSSKAMYPDFLSLDAGYVGEVYQRTGKPVSPMGCRAFLSDYQDENGESYFIGRANIGAVSLNLPMIWMKSKGETFYKDLDYYLEAAREFHKRRYAAIADNPCSTNPVMFTQGGIRGGHKQPDDKVGDLVDQFTASFGITSLNELNVLMEGKQLRESDRMLVNEVVDFIAKRVEQFKKEDGRLYALYGTPAESLAGTQLKQFRAKFGVIPGVSDREYFTNSFHCHVSAEITPFEKQDYEYELFHKITGGRINYVRLDNPKNHDAIKTVVKRGMRLGYYQGVNFDLVVCEECGFRPTKIQAVCPECGSKDITVTNRVCGYLGVRYSNGGTRFNESKLAECADRVSM